MITMIMMMSNNNNGNGTGCENGNKIIIRRREEDTTKTELKEDQIRRYSFEKRKYSVRKGNAPSKHRKKHESRVSSLKTELQIQTNLNSSLARTVHFHRGKLPVFYALP